METRRIYCLVPLELAGRLHDALRRHFAERGDVEVIIERRRHDRRAEVERREPGEREAQRSSRRRIRNPEGRRVAERRASLVPLAFEDAPELPRRARRYAEGITFVERLEPAGEAAEDADTARLVTRIQAGESALFSDLYTRYFDRVYGYLRVLLRDSHEAEDLTQHVFTQVLESLPRYERRRQPFRAWLFVVARNSAIDFLRRSGRIEVRDPADLDRVREGADDTAGAATLSWIADRELLLFVERLPETQRQVIALRYMLGLSNREIANVIDRSAEEVKVLHYRAMRFLRQRLAAIGRVTGRERPARVSRRFRQAEVLRHRRFALLR